MTKQKLNIFVFVFSELISKFRKETFTLKSHYLSFGDELIWFQTVFVLFSLVAAVLCLIYKKKNISAFSLF